MTLEATKATIIQKQRAGSFQQPNTKNPLRLFIFRENEKQYKESESNWRNI